MSIYASSTRPWRALLAAGTGALVLTVAAASPALATPEGRNGGRSGQQERPADDRNERATSGGNGGDDRNDRQNSQTTAKPSGGTTQGRSTSDPDGMSNGGADKPGGSGGVDRSDQDGNNGCGNDVDREDDNRGWCGGKPKSDKGASSKGSSDDRESGRDEDDDDDEDGGYDEYDRAGNRRNVSRYERGDRTVNPRAGARAERDAGTAPAAPDSPVQGIDVAAGSTATLSAASVTSAPAPTPRVPDGASGSPSAGSGSDTAVLSSGGVAPSGTDRPRRTSDLGDDAVLAAAGNGSSGGGGGGISILGVPVTRSALAFTGAMLALLMMLGAGLVTGGGALTVAGRRRTAEGSESETV